MQRSLVVGLVSTLLASPTTARAEEPREALERAVRAMGADLDLGRQPAVLATIRLQLPGQAEPMFAGTIHYQSATALRLEGDLVFPKNRGRISGGCDGARGWVVAPHGECQDIPLGVMVEIQAVTRLLDPALLPRLLADRTVTLGTLPDGAVRGRPTRRVKATLGDGTVLELQLDRDSGLLIAKSMKPREGGSELVLLLSDYREPGAAEDVRTLRQAGLGLDGPALLAYLRRQVPDPAKVARARALVRQLGDRSFARREEAGRDLVALGAVAIPYLEAALQDPDLEVARRARDCLGLLRPQTGAGPLAAAIREVARARVEGGVEALLRLLPSADGATAGEVKAALVALAERGGRPDPALVRALSDREPAVRAAAAAVLGRDGGAYRKQPGRRLCVPGFKLPMALEVLNGTAVVAEVKVVEMRLFNGFEPKVFARP
jgi:hypothetical protein